MTDRKEDGSEGGRKAGHRRRGSQVRTPQEDGRTDVALSCGLVLRQRRGGGGGGGGGESGKRGRVSMRASERANGLWLSRRRRPSAADGRTETDGPGGGTTATPPIGHHKDHLTVPIPNGLSATCSCPGKGHCRKLFPDRYLRS